MAKTRYNLGDKDHNCNISSIIDLGFFGMDLYQRFFG